MMGAIFIRPELSVFFYYYYFLLLGNCVMWLDEPFGLFKFCCWVRLIEALGVAWYLLIFVYKKMLI